MLQPVYNITADANYDTSAGRTRPKQQQNSHIKNKKQRERVIKIKLAFAPGNGIRAKC